MQLRALSYTEPILSLQKIHKWKWLYYFKNNLVFFNLLLKKWLGQVTIPKLVICSKQII